MCRGNYVDSGSRLDPELSGQDLAVDERRVITGATQRGQEQLARGRDKFSRFFAACRERPLATSFCGEANEALSAQKRRDVSESRKNVQDRLES
jgi:hypothetical protein